LLLAAAFSIGGLQLFANQKQSDAPGQTFYFAFSHAVQSLPSLTQGARGSPIPLVSAMAGFILKSPD